MTIPSLPVDILDLIFSHICPPPPTEWIHGVGNSKSQPPNIIWSESEAGYPINTLLLENKTNPGYKEYKLAIGTLANVARSCSLTRDLAERYLYRWVVLVRGGELACFVGAVEGRFQFRVGISSGYGDESGGFSRLGRYVWGLYCFVDMNREEDLMEWYSFEMQLEEWRTRRLLELGEKEKVDREEVMGEKKKKKKRKDKVNAGVNCGGGGLGSPEGDIREEAASSPPHNTNEKNKARGATPTKSTKATTAISNSSTARRNRRKKAQSAKVHIKPLDEIGTFFRLNSAMLDKDTYEWSRSDGLRFSPRNLYNLFLRLFLNPPPSTGDLLPNLSELLCSWYCIKLVTGMIKEPEYIPTWIPERVRLVPNPSVLHKIRSFTVRPPVKHKYPSSTTTVGAGTGTGMYYPWQDIAVTPGGILDAFPNLETLDTIYLTGGSDRSWGTWLERPLLETYFLPHETESEKAKKRNNGYALVKGAHRSHPIKILRIYRCSFSTSTLAEFIKTLRKGVLETLLVRFRHLEARDLTAYPGTILLGHEGLLQNGLAESLRYLELLSTPSRSYLVRTPEMEIDPRLRRLTCLPYLNGLEELVVDFQGLFGDIGPGQLELEQEYVMGLLERDECFPPNLKTLKVDCVWSSGAPEWYYISMPVGEYVVSGRDVSIFLRGLCKAHREGLLRLAGTLRRFVVVVPDCLKRVPGIDDDGVEGLERDSDNEREGRAISEARGYFEGTGVEFAVERGLDVLDSATGT